MTIDTISSQLDEAFGKIINSFEKFLERGSGFVLKEINEMQLDVAKYNPLRGSSYFPLPQSLGAKKAILNIQNFNDEKCLLWCLLAHKMKISKERKPYRVDHYISHENEIKMDNISYPVAYQKIPIIEKMNNIRINVSGYEEDEITILYISEREDEDVINLLLLANEHH